MSERRTMRGRSQGSSDPISLSPAIRNAAVAAAAGVYGMNPLMAINAAPSARGPSKKAQVAAAAALADHAGVLVRVAAQAVGVSGTGVHAMLHRDHGADVRAIAAARSVYAGAGIARPPVAAPEVSRMPIPGNRTRRSKAHEGDALAAFPDPTARGDCAAHLGRIAMVLGKGIGFPVLPFADRGPKVAGPWA